jgi:(E)-4-hydroxy-3-methylbut-2-enyl-diphosphate synthase
MGDVDYGFVGSGKDKINLYKGQKLIKRHVDTVNAVEELKKLMMEHGEWEAPV